MVEFAFATIPRNAFAFHRDRLPEFFQHYATQVEHRLRYRFSRTAAWNEWADWADTRQRKGKKDTPSRVPSADILRVLELLKDTPRLMEFRAVPVLGFSRPAMIGGCAVDADVLLQYKNAATFNGLRLSFPQYLKPEDQAGFAERWKRQPSYEGLPERPKGAAAKVASTARALTGLRVTPLATPADDSDIEEIPPPSPAAIRRSHRLRVPTAQVPSAPPPPAPESRKRRRETSPAGASSSSSALRAFAALPLAFTNSGGSDLSLPSHDGASLPAFLSPIPSNPALITDSHTARRLAEERWSLAANLAERLSNAVSETIDYIVREETLTGQDFGEPLPDAPLQPGSQCRVFAPRGGANSLEEIPLRAAHWMSLLRELYDDLPDVDNVDVEMVEDA